MQWKSVLFGAAASAALSFAAGRVFSADAPAGDDLTAPGPEHARLKTYEGNWDVSGTAFSPQGNSAVKGHQTGRMILGGRYLQLESEITVGDGQNQGMLEFVGYDRVQKKYVHVSMDTGSTTMTVDEGQHDDAKKMNVMIGTLQMEPGAKP